MKFIFFSTYLNKSENINHENDGKNIQRYETWYNNRYEESLKNYNKFCKEIKNKTGLNLVREEIEHTFVYNLNAICYFSIRTLKEFVELIDLTKQVKFKEGWKLISENEKYGVTREKESFYQIEFKMELIDRIKNYTVEIDTYDDYELLIKYLDSLKINYSINEFGTNRMITVFGGHINDWIKNTND